MKPTLNLLYQLNLHLFTIINFYHSIKTHDNHLDIARCLLHGMHNKISRGNTCAAYHVRG